MKLNNLPHACTFDYQHKISFVDTPLSVVLHDVIDEDGRCVTFKRSDVSFIFDTNKLSEVGNSEGILKAMMDNFRKNQQGIDTSQFSDDDLLQFVPSRYNQTLSERARWFDYLKRNENELLSRINYAKEQVKVKQSKSKEIQETTKTD